MSSIKKAKYMQKFKDEWIELEPFRSWVAKSKKGDGFGYCKVCGCDVAISNGGKYDLIRHKSTIKHVTQCKGQKSISDSMPSTSKETKLSNQIKEAELRLSSYVAEHNIPFLAAEHLPNLIKAICPDSQIAKGINLGRTKATCIIKNVLGDTEKEELCSRMRIGPFSIIVDESTDKSTEKHLCIVVRTMKSGEVIDAFFDLVPIKDGTAMGIHKEIIASLDKCDIPWRKNLIGYAADGANVMMGKHNSVNVLLKQDLPYLYTMKCICHSFALCASYAVEKLPRFVEDLVRNVYNYIQTSPKRIKHFKEFQTFLNLKPHKILHPCQTRWLSLHTAVARVLEQFEALKLYFIDAVANDRLTAPQNILQGLNNPFAELYLHFLNFILPVFNNMNKLMQSEGMQIHRIRSNVEAIMRTFVTYYMQPNYVKSTNIEEIQYNDPRFFLPLESVYVGAQVTTSLQNLTLDTEDVKQFRINILNFYVEACRQIFKRFSFSDPILKHMEILDPQTVKSAKYGSIAPLAARFPNLVKNEELQELDNDWRLLQNTDIDFESPNAEDFWKIIGKKTYRDGSLVFPVLTKLVENMMCLPHSSASVERVFSQININKTKLRNRLHTKTLCGIMHSKRIFEKETCYSHETKKFLPKFTSRMYDDDSDSDA